MPEPAVPPRLYYMPRTRSSRVLWLLEEIVEPYEREMLRPWPGLEAYVRRGESRPARAKAAAISSRPRT